MRLPKNTPHAAKASRNPSNTGLNRKNSLLSHRNSRLSCYTACPPCLTPGPWPKSPSTWTRQVNGCQKWEDFFLRMSTFSVQVTRTPLYKPLKIQSVLKTVKGVLADLELRIIKFFSEWLVALLIPARHVLETRSPHLSFMLRKDYWFKELYLGLFGRLFRPTPLGFRQPGSFQSPRH